MSSLPMPKSERTGRTALISVGLIGIVAIALHLAALVGGPEWLKLLHAPAKVIASSQAGTWTAPAVIFSICAALAIASIYAFSGAGAYRRLPFVRAVLAVVAALALMRAALWGVMFLAVPRARPALLEAVELISAIVFFLVGIGTAIGLARRWSALRMSAR